MELVWQPYSIIPVYQGQRGFSLFLTADQGRLLPLDNSIEKGQYLSGYSERVDRSQIIGMIFKATGRAGTLKK
jgi:hypothetical protein